MGIFSSKDGKPPRRPADDRGDIPMDRAPRVISAPPSAPKPRARIIRNPDEPATADKPKAKVSPSAPRSGRKKAAVTTEMKDANKRLSALAKVVKSKTATATTAILQSGQALCEAHLLLSSYHGGSFSSFVVDRCGISRPTAYKLMGAWERFGDSCKIVYNSAEPEAISRLAKADQEVVNKALSLMEGGDRLTLSKAKELLSSAKTPKKDSAVKPEPVIIQTDSGSVRIIARPGVSVRRCILDALAAVPNDVADRIMDAA